LFKERKLPFFVRLPESLVERFREYVNLKYSTDRYGWQSYEVELALNNHLATQTAKQQRTQACKGNENRIYKVEHAMQEINTFFIQTQKYIDPPKFIPENLLDEAIANLHGSDSRTINKWKALLVKYGQIKRNGRFQFEVLI
jgi:hypothetical protein